MYDIYDNDFDKAFDEAVEAIEKKEHRLIYADKLKAHYAWWKGGTREMTMDEAKSGFDTIIDLQPTVEAEPIRHGRNIATEYDDVDEFVCSECGLHLENWVSVEVDEDTGEKTYHEFRLRRCPYCGARMDEVEE